MLAASTRTLAVGAGVVAVCWRHDQQVSRAVPHQVTSHRGHHIVALRLAFGANSHVRAGAAMRPTLEARSAGIVDIHSLPLSRRLGHWAELGSALFILGRDDELLAHLDQVGRGDVVGIKDFTQRLAVLEGDV